MMCSLDFFMPKNKVDKNENTIALLATFLYNV